MRPEVVQKYEQLKAAFREKSKVLVALSGGVDSTLLQAVAHEVLGYDNAICVTAKSETLTETEFHEVCSLARERGWNHHVIEYSELEIPNYAQNPVNRCYFCKTELFTKLRDVARQFGCEVVVEGTNYDDRGDYRPGMQAAREQGTWAPLLECQITKEEIREMARGLGLPTWSKPSGACLSSRFPYGPAITREGLRQVAAAETFLRDLGFTQVRVRHHGNLARIEVLPTEFSRFADAGFAATVAEKFRELGYVYVTLDLLGYRSGSMNEVLRSATQSVGS